MSQGEARQSSSIVYTAARSKLTVVYPPNGNGEFKAVFSHCTEQVNVLTCAHGDLKPNSNCLQYREHELRAGVRGLDRIPHKGDVIVADVCIKKGMVLRWRFAQKYEKISPEEKD
jgi:hypothetical protein